ncbi:uncharacterized protein LOC132538747 [Erinaceus europaeus]|uniref:Uncharacterized protein LOC132538745 n=1 Tax=Erinaceus europaeus TaxID=9365 RepID=A0ABM3XGE2_ERIEU|nr:uncharacterized protein LOC132538745 [Erinaceus europaeus]XP_060047895.1 uncharacterized protein LOC132538746 [Erinaceus europaeus]XP_060047896.1 uncharacterized protein LOC132538747 [Erinaceus europaeus]
MVKSIQGVAPRKIYKRYKNCLSLSCGSVLARNRVGRLAVGGGSEPWPCALSLQRPQPYCTEVTDVIEGEPPLCEETEEQQETQNVCNDAPYLLVSEERYRGGLPAQAGGCCPRKGNRVRLVVSGNHLHGDIVLHRPPKSPRLAEHTAPAPQSSPQPEGTAEMARAAEGPLPSTPPPAQAPSLQARPRVIPWQMWLLSLCARTSMESEVAQLAVVQGQELNLPSLRHKLIFFFAFCVIMLTLLYICLYLICIHTFFDYFLVLIYVEYF